MSEASEERERRKKEESEDPRGMPIIAMHDRKSKAVMAHVVHEKGPNEYAISRVANEIRNLGYNKIIFKSDQEPAIKALKNKVKEEMTDVEIIMEESPVGDHKSNGEIENAIRRYRGKSEH